MSKHRFRWLLGAGRGKDSQHARDFPGCPAGWTLHGTMCYRGSENVVDGEQAKLACEDRQAVLASVHDQETAEFIDNFMTR